MADFIEEDAYGYNYDKAKPVKGGKKLPTALPKETKSKDAAPKASVAEIINPKSDGNRTAAARVQTPAGTMSASLDAISPPELTDAGGYRGPKDKRTGTNSKAQGSMKTDLGLSQKLFLDPEVMEQLPILLERYKTPTMRAREDQANKTAAALELLSKDYAQGSGDFDLGAVLHPAAALLDTWAGRGRLTDAFGYKPKENNKFKNLAETSKQLTDQRKSLSDDERDLMKILLGNTQKDDLSTTLSAMRQLRIEPEVKEGLASALAQERFNQAQQNKIEEGVADYEKFINDPAVSDIISDITSAGDILTNYKEGDAPGYYQIPGQDTKWKAPDIINRLNPLLSNSEREEADRLANVVANIRASIVKRYSGAAFAQAEVKDTERRLGTALTQGPEALRRELNNVRDKIIQWEEIKKRKYSPAVKQTIEQRGVNANVENLKGVEFGGKIKPKEESEKGSTEPGALDSMREGLKNIWKTK